MKMNHAMYRGTTALIRKLGVINLNKSKIVNSYHNHGFSLLSDELICVAEAEDYSIEAFIHKKLKIFGQMWHPEREDPFKDFDLKLIKIFFND